MAISRSNMNKIKGPSIEKRRRLQKAKAKSLHPKPAVITASKNLSRKKLKKVEKALRNEKRWMASKGLIVNEEEMTDVVEVPPEKRRVMVTIPEEILLASASGSGTTLGGY
ncbi:uncharacterized protein BX664DRAFT_322938 [Halteromyces radiatus]|uniref:uncharacterized protein n=1 Tax=Halteromyces radiatus TaxID=101107 RepID=UPI00221EF2E7|nr:uncharacterized protein BX664DRAFT_322938 [Halteromyces radiatus]KAI8100126.1 hypothetical protein BX664DRAFT_322938 [Halteromyces radiatus]